MKLGHCPIGVMVTSQKNFWNHKPAKGISLKEVLLPNKVKDENIIMDIIESTKYFYKHQVILFQNNYYLILHTSFHLMG